MTYGYARCSTNEDRQDITRQVRELKSHGADRIFLEYEHGASPQKKELNALLETISPGDTLLTTEVSRLSRSTRQLCDLIETVQQKRLRLSILGSLTIDCRRGEIDPMTKAFLQIAGVFSEVELEMTRARIKSGLAHARANGKRLGRPPTTPEQIPAIFYRHYPAYVQGSLNVSELARVCKLSRPSVYKYLRIFKDTQKT